VGKRASPPQIEEAAERGEKEQARRRGEEESGVGRQRLVAEEDWGFGGGEEAVVREVVESLVAQVDLILQVSYAIDLRATIKITSKRDQYMCSWWCGWTW